MSDLLLVLGPNASQALGTLERASPSRAREAATHAEPGFAATVRHHATEGSSVAVLGDDVLAINGRLDLDSSELREILLHRPGRLAHMPHPFSLALFSRHRRTLLIATDRSAMRPLYWVRVGDRFLASSFVASLARHPDCPRVVSQQTLLEAVTYQRPVSGTFYRDIHPVPPGSVMALEDGHVRVESYHQMRFRDPSFPRKEAPRRIAEGISRAVDRALPDGTPAAMLLSGGFDSRVLLAAARRPVIGITQALHRNREVEIAEEVARAAGIPWHLLPIEPQGYHEHFAESVRITGGTMRPHNSHFLLTMPRILEFASVVVSGWGIDTMFRGGDLPKRKTAAGGKSVQIPLSLAPLPRGDLVPMLARTLKHTLSGPDADGILRAATRAERWPRLEGVVRRSVGDVEGYEAWDRVGLQCRSTRQTFGDAISIQVWGDLRVPGQDAELQELLLELPARWRANDRLCAAAASCFLPDGLADIPLANTGLSPRVDPRLSGLWGFGRLALEYLGFNASTAAARMGTHGSWPDFRRLLRENPSFVADVRALPRSEALAACGIFEPAGVESLVRRHLAREYDGELLLLMLMAIRSWIEQFGADGAA